MYATRERSKRSLLAGRTADFRAASDHDLTVIIPAYNEERRLPATLADLRVFLDAWGLDYRVLVADDGSSDGTASLAERAGERFSTLSLPCHGGKGMAVRTAMLRATGDVLAFSDADLPYHLSALRQGYERVRTGQCHVVFGSRALRESTSAVVRRPWRRLASYLFRAISRRLVSREVLDTQCGLKLFGRRAAQDIFSRVVLDGFAFDAEVVWLTERLGWRYQQIPVTLIHDHESSLSATRHAIPMLLDVLRLWRRARREATSLPHSEATRGQATSPADDESLADSASGRPWRSI